MDTIANFLSAIKNGVAKGHEKVDSPFSKLKVEIARVMKEEGYIAGYRVMEENKIPFVRVQLRYTDARAPVISGLKRVSRPGLRIYRKWDAIGKVNGGMGVAVLSTSKGLMTSKKARRMKLGGEVLCHVW